MVPYTTPKHIFRLGFSTSLISEVRVFYKQNNNIVLQKETEDCEFVGNNVVIELSEADTSAFADNVIIKIQLEVIDINGIVARSRPKMVSPTEALREEVL